MADNRIGLDVGGSKIAALCMDEHDRELERQRIATPDNYPDTITAITTLVHTIEARQGRASVGVGMPGTVVPRTGLIKNANRAWLNGQPFQRDLSDALGREVRCANDADCFAASEANDGAASGAAVAFAVILGTGCGAGIAIDGRPHVGAGGVAGEWGHNALPWPHENEFPGPDCYCGKRGCLEMWVSGPGLAADHLRVEGMERSAEEIAAAASRGDAGAEAAMLRFEDRLARGIATVVNIIDPDVIVLGGGLSNVERLYTTLPRLVPRHVFGQEWDTPVRPARYGDASGVRGAAFLWPR